MMDSFLHFFLHLLKGVSFNVYNDYSVSVNMVYIIIGLWSYFQNSHSMVPPPAPPLKAQTSPLANMFSQELPRSPLSPEPYSGKIVNTAIEPFLGSIAALLH